MKTRYWIQEYNSAGNNWIDYVGFSPDKSQAEALADLTSTSNCFKHREFRLVTRQDILVATPKRSKLKKATLFLDVVQ